jgi:hypothetical protein
MRDGGGGFLREDIVVVVVGGRGGGELVDVDGAGDNDEDDSGSASAVANGGVGTAMPKGVSSSFTLEEEATWPVVETCVGRERRVECTRSLRVCCDGRWANEGTVRN